MHNCILILCLITGAFADLQTPKNSGIIVNPFYDPKTDANEIKKIDLDEVLPPTHQQLAETFNLRNLINNAVRSNTYAVGGSATSFTTPKKPIFPWLNFGLKFGKNLASTNPDEVLGSEGIGFNETGTTIPNHLTHNEASEIKSNLIDSVIVSRLEKNPFSILQKKNQREQLELISIEEDVSFPHGHNIRSWITIETKANGKKGLVGISNSSLVLIVERTEAYEIVEELDLKTPILCFTNYQHWNQTSKSVHGLIIVEIANQLMFISTRDDLSGLEIIWQWTIQSGLDSLFYFKHESSDMMLMINAPFADDNRISADIYRFDLESRHTWLIQKIPLAYTCKSVAVINTYRDLILCFAQNNTVELYKSDQHAQSQAFKYFSTIEANNVRTVSGFQMGGFSYLGTTGLEPKIFRYHRGAFVAQTILSRRWGLVEVIFPIPARTYRDDLILLVQHRILMGTHTVAVVEALIWDGQSFDVSLSVPCRIGDEIMDFGMTCLLDYDRDSGIDGLSIIQNGNSSISLIVPRFEAPSSMFRLKFELTSFDSPSSTVVRDFEILQKNIEAITNYQTDIMSKGADALTRGLSSNGNRNDVNAVWNLLTVTAGSVVVNDGAMCKFDEIYFGNEKWTDEDLNYNFANLVTMLQQLESDVDILENEFREKDFVEQEQDSPVYNIPVKENGKFETDSVRTLNDRPRPKRSGESERQMKFNRLNVKNIKVDYINDIPIEDVIFTQNGVLNSVNSLIVENNLNVLNDVEVKSERMETVGDTIEEKHLFENFIPANNIHITGNLSIESINGVVWQDFVQRIVMRNMLNFIDKLTVQGDIVAKENIEVDFLNDISFPLDFLWMHGSDTSIIAGQKDFKGTLTAGYVDTSGTVDGLSTLETISLDEEQRIGGLTTFTQLEVTETLDVKGSINGKHLNDFKPNLSLLESNVISSDCLFQNLQVEGSIIITNDCNGVNLDNILSDVVYKSEPKPVITSLKTFESVESTVELTSNLINGIPVDHYMTIDTTQDIHFDQFIGNVIINNLYTDGLFDFINITELDRNSIKLMGEQFTEAELIFTGDEINIDVDTVEIQSLFNGLSPKDLIRIDEALEINGNVIVNSVMINDLVISGEVNGKGVINGRSLSEFDQIRFSRTRAQDITSLYHIENVGINNDIDSLYVNGLDITDLRKHINHITNLPEFLSSTDVKVNNLVIDGNLLVRTINGHDLDSIKDNAIWLNQENIVDGDLQFLDRFEIGVGLIVDNVKGENFDNFVNGLVLKTDDNVQFTGRNIFQNEFHVEQDMQINTLNGISTNSIWTKSTTIPITGRVNVIGNLVVENVNLQGFLNSVYWREIEDKYYFNAERRAHILRSNARFTNPTNIDDLHIEHGLNSVENITGFLSNIIRKNHDGIISGKKQFQSNVIFVNQLIAANMDNVHIPSLFENVAINEVNQKIIIFGDVMFEDAVNAPHFHVSDDIWTSTVMDCSLSEWNENALRTNSPIKIFQTLIFPAGTFQATNVELQFLNGNSMVTIFTLHSDQFFGHALLSDVVSTSNINVTGLVNGYNMKEIVDNSVLITGDNYITAPTTLQSARVLSVLQTGDTINGKNLKNIATLHEDLYLYGPLTFQSINARNLITKDTITGIDFDYWYANALWKSQRENQIVSGVWTVTEGIFHSTVKGDATLNGMPIENLAGQIEAQQSNVQNNFAIFNQSYVENCQKIQKLVEKTQTLPYFLTHFEEAFSLRVQNLLNSVHFFEANGQNYVVINLGCLTVLYVWNRNIENYEKIVETETGNVDSWLDKVDETNLIHLISNTEADRSNCPTSGLNIWKFDGSSLVHVTKITDSNKFSLLYSSKLHPQRFLAMTKDEGVIKAFDLQNNLVEQWHLPMNDQQYRFVPENANLGIALSNGKQLSSLSYAKSIITTENRKGRSIGPLSDSIELIRPKRCPYLDEKLEILTAKCKLWNQANMKALAYIGPYKNVDASTQNRLLKDVSMSNIQVGSSPIKPKNGPSGRGPYQSSNLMPIPAQNGQLSIVTTDTETMTNTAANPIGNDIEPVNSTTRDAFGDLQEVVINVADNIVDPLIEVEADKQNIDFDDSLVGSSSKDESKMESTPMMNSLNTSTTQTNNSKNFKNTAKESQAKLHDLFVPKNNDLNKNREKIEIKNLPKIPKVIYTSNDTDLHATQSLHVYETDGTDKSTTSVEDSSTTTTTEPTAFKDEHTTSTTEPTTFEEEHTTTTTFEEEKVGEEEVGEEEPKISNEISSEGIATAENLNFPNHPAEEIVALTVGENKKHLVAVSSLREHSIQGKHDLIRIYEDIIEGNLFQTLVCHRPRSLSVLNIRDESILAFIENDAEIQILVYRGIQGFVKFTSFELPSFISKLTSFHLPVGNPFACTKSYLAATMKKEIRFIEAKTCGYCGVNAQLRCD